MYRMFDPHHPLASKGIVRSHPQPARKPSGAQTYSVRGCESSTISVPKSAETLPQKELFLGSRRACCSQAWDEVGLAEHTQQRS
jgi:hypothetical protein